MRNMLAAVSAVNNFDPIRGVMGQQSGFHEKIGAVHGTAPNRLQLANGSRLAAHEEINSPEIHHLTILRLRTLS